VGLTLFDTSAVVGLLDRDDALHDAAARAFGEHGRRRDRFAASAVSWAELLVGAARGYYRERLLRGLFDEMAIEIVAVDTAVAERAAHLRAAYLRRHGSAALRLPDALILATAETAVDCTGVVTGDRGWDRVPGLRVPLLLLSPAAH